MAEQVPAAYPLAESGIAVSLRPLASESDTASAVSGHIYVKQGDIIPVIERPATKPKATPRKRGPGRPRKPRQGGWRTTSYISRELRKETRRKATLLQAEGYDFTVFASARGLRDRPDNEAKRHICREFSRLGEMLGDKGHSYIGLVSYEKIDGVLHGHLSLHVLLEQMSLVKAWADRFDETPLKPNEIVEGVNRHACPFRPHHRPYALKQHRWCGKHEAKLGFYQKGEPFAGTRVSFTKEARAIIERAEARAATLAKRLAGRAEPPRLRIVVSNALVPEPEQLSLFPSVSRPVSRLAHYCGGVMPPAIIQEIEARRRWRGLTQEALARHIGISRPQFCNAVNGMFGLSQWAASRLREFLLPPTPKVAS